jgi:hypothetical protein
MNTIVGVLVGVCFSAIFTSVVCLSCYMGFGNPNYFPENGETYIGWALTLFGSTAMSFALLGLIFDTVGMIHRFVQKRA